MAKIIRTAKCDGCGETKKCTYYGREAIDLCASCEAGEELGALREESIYRTEDTDRATRMSLWNDLTDDGADF